MSLYPLAGLLLCLLAFAIMALAVIYLRDTTRSRIARLPGIAEATSILICALAALGFGLIVAVPIGTPGTAVLIESLVAGAIAIVTPFVGWRVFRLGKRAELQDDAARAAARPPHAMT